MVGYIFGGDTGETPTSLRRKRDIQEALIAKAVGRVPQNVGEGLSAVGAALASRMMDAKLNRTEREGQAGAFGHMAAIGEALNARPSGGAASSSSSAAPASAAQTDPNVGSTIDFANAGTPSQKFSGGQKEFVEMLLPAAIEASKRTGIDPRIIVAQAAQETGWGRSAPGNNYFGIKSHGKGGGQTFTTHEVINGKRVKMQDSFRQFASPEDSVMGYADFMTQNKRYGPMRQAQGLDAQLAALGQSGYATDPNYAQSVGNIARGIQLPEMPQQQQPVQTASLDPSSGVVEALGRMAAPPVPPEYANMGLSPESWAAMNAPDGAVPQQQPAPVQPQQQVAQAGPQPLPNFPPAPQPPAGAQDVGPSPMSTDDLRGGVDMGMLMRAASDPWLNESQRSIVNALMQRQLESQDPANQMALEKARLELEQMRNPQGDPFTLSPGQQRFGPDGKPIATVAPKDERPWWVRDDGSVDPAQLANQSAGRSSTNVTVGGGDNKQIFDAMNESKAAAAAAATGLNSLREAEAALDSGIISGAFADEQLMLQKVGAAFGITDPTMVQNTETFRSAIAPQVAAMLKSTVGSAQISNADREFAEKAAGGSIKLDAGTMKRLVSIMRKGGQAVLKRHIDTLNKVYPEGGGFDRERALFDVPMMEEPPPPSAPAISSPDPKRFGGKTDRLSPSFATEKDAMDAISSGKVKVGDTITVNGRTFKVVDD